MAMQLVGRGWDMRLTHRILGHIGGVCVKVAEALLHIHSRQRPFELSIGFPTHDP